MSLTVDIWDYVLSNESIRSVSALRAIPISFYEMFIYLHPRMSFFSNIQIDVLQMAKSVDAHVLVAFKFGAVMLTWMTYPYLSFYNKINILFSNIFDGLRNSNSDNYIDYIEYV